MDVNLGLDKKRIPGLGKMVMRRWSNVNPGLKKIECDKTLMEIRINSRDAGWVWIPDLCEGKILGHSDELVYEMIRARDIVMLVELTINLFVVWCNEIYVFRFDLVDSVSFS